jgi:TrmH family RNA methyltransferase
MKTIESAKNDHFRSLVGLTESRHLKRTDEMIIPGTKLIKEAATDPDIQITQVVYNEKGSRFTDVTFPATVSEIALSNELFQELDTLGTKSPLAIAKQPPVTEQPKTFNKGLLYLPLGDPKNLGAAIRSAHSFGFSKVVLLKEACHPFLPEVTKASAGLNLKVDFLKGPSIEDLTEELCPQTVSLDMDGTEISKLGKGRTYSLLVGQEGPGIPAHLSFPKVKIPMYEGTESLNATVALSIALYELSK